MILWITGSYSNGMSKEAGSQLIASGWSEPTNGLSGRLRVEFEDINPGIRLAVYTELKNHSFEPVTVTNQPKVQAELFDSSQRSIGTAGLTMSGPIPRQQWATIPSDAYIGFRVDMQTVGVPAREHGKALLALGNKSWELQPGEYVLKVSLEFKQEKDGPTNQWTGKLELPTVQVVITHQMIKAN